MSGVFVPPGKQQFLNPEDGSPLVGGKVYHYIPNTDTPKDTFVDQAETATNSNPIILDGSGECTIWGEGLYRQKLYDADDNPIWDQITGFLGGGGGDVTFASPSQVADGTSMDTVISPYALFASGVLGGGGSGGYGWAKPLSTFGTLDLSGVTVGANDSIIAAAEADATNHFYIPFGTIRTNLTQDQLTKGYKGDGGLITGPGAGDGAYRPPIWSYMAVKPTTWPVQGQGGWFRGDQRFTDSGEWKIIGPGVRTYDLTQRYFESNTIPHHAWWDLNSGNSGAQAFLFSGAAAGSTVITISGAATLEWVGKTVGFANGMDGTLLESHVVSSVSGNTITISTALTNTYTWNPGVGAPGQPCIYFGHRTNAPFRYIKATANAGGGGDVYGDVVRAIQNYVPKASEYHSFMAGTIGQYGGDITFGTSGTYATGWESQHQGQTFDVTAIGFVHSFARNNDYALDGGKFWAGTYFQSTGTRASDVGHGLVGQWRNGLDTARATILEASRLTVVGNSGNITITVASVNGAHPNGQVIIGSEAHVIQSVNTGTLTITLTTNLVGNFAVDTYVSYTNGGAAVNLASGQRIIWNSSFSANARGGDPTGVFSTFYGNVQGDLIMESSFDGSGEFWAVRFGRGTTAAAPDTARIRMRPNAIQMFATGGMTVNGTLGLTSSLNMLDNMILTLGTGIWLVAQGGHLQATNNFGASFVNIV